MCWVAFPMHFADKALTCVTNLIQQVVSCQCSKIDVRKYIRIINSFLFIKTVTTNIESYDN